MPQRFLKPGLRESVRWNMCTEAAQNLFIRLITIVDDFGRYDAHVLTLARLLYPFGEPPRSALTDAQIEALTLGETPNAKTMDAKKIRALLEELTRQDIVLVYHVDGKRYLQINRWTERSRAEKSRYPSPTLANNCPTPDSKFPQMLSKVVTIPANPRN